MLAFARPELGHERDEPRRPPQDTRINAVGTVLEVGATPAVSFKPYAPLLRLSR